MRRARSLLVLFVALASTVVSGLNETNGQGKVADQPMSFWMKKKLEYSQQILAGLAMERFDRIQSTAEAMRKLGRIEAFARHKDAEDYRTQLRVFDFANAELIRLAKEENLDGAATAFNQLTLSCLNCHKLLRDTKE
jgi:hypothetical protein